MSSERLSVRSLTKRSNELLQILGSLCREQTVLLQEIAKVQQDIAEVEARNTERLNELLQSLEILCREQASLRQTIDYVQQDIFKVQGDIAEVEAQKEREKAVAEFLREREEIEVLMAVAEKEALFKRQLEERRQREVLQQEEELATDQAIAISLQEAEKARLRGIAEDAELAWSLADS